jgi:hypothetical protein
MSSRLNASMLVTCKYSGNVGFQVTANTSVTDTFYVRVEPAVGCYQWYLTISGMLD